MRTTHAGRTALLLRATWWTLGRAHQARVVLAAPHQNAHRPRHLRARQGSARSAPGQRQRGAHEPAR
eukprot:5538261-Pyramimonas_sp.AAC.1